MPPTGPVTVPSSPSVYRPVWVPSSTVLSPASTMPCTCPNPAAVLAGASGSAGVVLQPVSSSATVTVAVIASLRVVGEIMNGGPFRAGTPDTGDRTGVEGGASDGAGIGGAGPGRGGPGQRLARMSCIVVISAGCPSMICCARAATSGFCPSVSTDCAIVTAPWW